ncbi:unnamed protein product [Protopolystoma xenopodis]|uniref:Uncharacterized protein n=1 Tax=Protopolystoma xenopodis TaxID=117903 RepID=A0A3S5AEU2_9PLAT|nr:unnamed protein product [Protopolystoma xenopodis]
MTDESSARSLWGRMTVSRNLLGRIQQMNVKDNPPSVSGEANLRIPSKEMKDMPVNTASSSKANAVGFVSHLGKSPSFRQKKSPTPTPTNGGGHANQEPNKPSGSSSLGRSVSSVSASSVLMHANHHPLASQTPLQGACREWRWRVSAPSAAASLAPHRQP